MPISVQAVGGADPTAAQMDILYDTAHLTLTQARPGAAAMGANKQVSTAPLKSQQGTRLIVVGLNNQVIQEGVLVELVFTVNSATAPKTLPLSLTQVVTSNAAAKGLTTRVAQGSITIQ